MKKYCVMALLFAAHANAADLTRDDVVGKWICATRYEAIGTMTMDAYEYLADGNSKSKGMVLTPLSDQMALHFTVEKSGKWSFDKGILSETTNTEKVSREHNEATMAELKKSKELAELEHSFYQTLSENPENETERTIQLQWTRDSKEANKILIKQIDGTNGEGFCWRKENQNADEK